jgi:hypothetical protein
LIANNRRIGVFLIRLVHLLLQHELLGRVLLGLLILGAGRPLHAQLAALVLAALDADESLLGLAVRAKVDERVLIPHDGALEHVAVLIEQLLHLLLVHVFGEVGHVQFRAHATALIRRRGR